MFVAGALYGFAQAVVALLHGSVPAAATAGGMAVFCSGVAATFTASCITSPRLYAVADDRGTTLRTRPLIVWCWIVTLAGAAVGSTCYLVFVSYGQTQLPFAAPGRSTVIRYLMISLLVLALLGLAALVTRREAGYLRISTAGIENADIFRTRSARWDDIVDIADEADRKVRNPIVFAGKEAGPVVVPNADSYAAGSAALYWMVQHYWKHPDDRGELTDGRALEHLRNEQFAPE